MVFKPKLCRQVVKLRSNRNLDNRRRRFPLFRRINKSIVAEVNTAASRAGTGLGLNPKVRAQAGPTLHKPKARVQFSQKPQKLHKHDFFCGWQSEFCAREPNFHRLELDTSPKPKSRWSPKPDYFQSPKKLSPVQLYGSKAGSSATLRAVVANLRPSFRWIWQPYDYNIAENLDSVLNLNCNQVCANRLWLGEI